MTTTQPVTEQAAVYAACYAVFHAARPRDRARLDAVELAERIFNRADEATSVGWWNAYGADLSVALTIVCSGVDETDASYLIGAALQAHITAGLDLVPDSILRLAERAACYRQGLEDGGA